MINLINDDAAHALKLLASNSYDCCVTSPPYYKQRDYQHASQIGLAGTIEDYISSLVTTFREVGRVLKPTGILWLNLGDKYHKKNLLGLPWRVALALQDDGWFLRSCVVWRKENIKPDGATDRPTNEYEFVFMLTTNDKYYFNADAVREEPADYKRKGGTAPYLAEGMNTDGLGSKSLHQMSENGRNVRNIWTINNRPGAFATHYAAFPPELPEKCIKASCPDEGGNVIDIYAGTGTTGLVADRLGHDVTLIEINPDYCSCITDRLTKDAPLLVNLNQFDTRPHAALENLHFE